MPLVPYLVQGHMSKGSKMLLRVILSEMDIRRLSIENTPHSVEELCKVLRSNLSLRGRFLVQFEDPAFKDQLTNLTDIRDLPEERATLKVVFTADPDLSDSTLDTASLPSVSSGEPDSQQWPEPFLIPEFSWDVELLLRESNAKYAKDGAVMDIPKSVKSDILDTLADSMSKISPYPEKHHYENVAKSLVEKHPSLTEPGSGKGWFTWFHSLKFKLGNYRQKLSAAGCPEVRVNKRKGPDAKGPRVKKSKKGEVHYLPDPPEGLSSEDIEEKRKIMEVEILKKDPNHQLLEELMTATFSQRRKEIVGDQPLIRDVMTRWPTMFDERQIRAEFKRVVNTNLLETFLEGLDDVLKGLLEVYEAATKAGKKPALKVILECLKKDDTNERRRTAALLGLPHYLSEQPSEVIRMCDAHNETLDEAMKGMQLGLLIGYEGDNQEAFPREIFNVAVVVEETILLHNFKNVPTAFAMLLGVIYCVNLEYPRVMKYSFEFLQKVVLKIKPDQASARVHGFRNKLLRYKL